MANNYSQAAAYEGIPCTREECDAITDAFRKNIDNVEDHGFDFEFDGSEFYLFAEEYATPEYLPEEVCVLIGKLLKRNHKPWLKVGCSFTCDKLRPGEFGGYDFKIGQDGSIVYPKTVWPAGYED